MSAVCCTAVQKWKLARYEQAVCCSVAMARRSAEAWLGRQGIRGRLSPLWTLHCPRSWGYVSTMRLAQRAGCMRFISNENAPTNICRKGEAARGEACSLLIPRALPPLPERRAAHRASLGEKKSQRVCLHTFGASIER